jgi:hypothetical protein
MCDGGERRDIAEPQRRVGRCLDMEEACYARADGPGDSLRIGGVDWRGSDAQAGERPACKLGDAGIAYIR